MTVSVYYTITPSEVLWDEESSSETGTIIEWHDQGAIMQVELVDASHGRIRRLISPNPQDYLDPRRMPGQIVRLQPSL